MSRDSLTSHIPGRKHKQAVAQQSYKKRNTSIAAAEKVTAIRRASESFRVPRRTDGSYAHAQQLPATPVDPDSESDRGRDPYTMVCDDEDACEYIAESNASCDALVLDHNGSLDRLRTPVASIALDGELREPTSSAPVVTRAGSRMTISCDIIDLDSLEAIVPGRAGLHHEGDFHERVALRDEDIVVVLDDESSSNG
jgi:hypothetical protein